MTTNTVAAELPAEWQSAYERDRAGLALSADPAPERRAGKMLAAFIFTGLAFLALPGTLLGVWNLLSIAEQQASGAASIAWIQAHGQAQLFGWVGTFILGISLYILPKFRGHSLKRFGEAWAVWLLWSVGVAWRWWSGVSGQGWRVGLVASALLEVGAFALTMHVVVFGVGSVQRQKTARRPSDLGSWLGIYGFSALGLALLLNLGISVRLSLYGAGPVYPAIPDRIFLLIALWGFAAPVAWGYSTRFVTIFLGLEPPVHPAARWMCAGIVVVVLGSLARQFLVADAAALALTVTAIWATRVFRPSARQPKTAGVYRYFTAFARLAYVWLVVGAVLGVLADLLPKRTGLGGASRHAVTVGFLATLIFSIGPRILPAFLSGRELYSRRLMAASLWLLSLGCALRVSSETAAYSGSGISWRILPVSALVELTAVILFVVNMGITLARPVPAWFGLEGVKATLPVYWYVTSFPQTRPLLIGAGLKTLARVREVPRSLTLADAARADGANIEGVLAQLRGFFSRRQPRRNARQSL